MTVDTQQEGGKHYKQCPPEFQHWNLVLIHDWDYFQSQVIKYVMRYKEKNGVEDLKKARHFLEKMIETETGRGPRVTPAPDFLQYVKPTGWVAFEFEGADAEGFWYRCGKCRERIAVQQYQSPWLIHDADQCKQPKI